MIFKIVNDNDVDDRDVSYYWDCKRIQEVLRNNGYILSLYDCERIWNEYSTMVNVGWMGLPDDDYDLWNILKNRL